MSDTEERSRADPEAPPVDYRQALVESMPRVGLLLLVSVVGYYYVTTWWWVVIFVFGAMAVVTDRIYYRKTLRLRERLRP